MDIPPPVTTAFLILLDVGIVGGEGHPPNLTATQETIDEEQIYNIFKVP